MKNIVVAGTGKVKLFRAGLVIADAVAESVFIPPKDSKKLIILDFQMLAYKRV